MTNVVSLPSPSPQKCEAPNQQIGLSGPRYTICKKRLLGAYAAEFLIAGTAFAGSVLMAEKYAPTGTDFYLMILAPIVYVVVELSRVPLALSIRINPSKAMKCIAVLGVICAAGITTKSMSQLGEMMFRPRLAAVEKAKRDDAEAQDALATQTNTIEQAKALVAQKRDEVADTDARLKSVSSAIGLQPGQSCGTVTGRRANGVLYQYRSCSKNPATVALARQLDQAEKDRNVAAMSLDAANAALKNLAGPELALRATAADTTLKEAIFESQIHSFAAMVFGIAPLEVTDSQIHVFLRLFVFIPAILAAVASTLLAMTAVTFLPQPTSPDYRLTTEESHRVMKDALTAAADHVKSTIPPKVDGPKMAQAGR